MPGARTGVSVNDVARPQPADEGSPARLIAVMVGIVGILLLGSLAWSAVGALFSTLGEAAAAVTSSGTPPPRLAVAVGTPSPQTATRATSTDATRYRRGDARADAGSDADSRSLDGSRVRRPRQRLRRPLRQAVAHRGSCCRCRRQAPAYHPGPQVIEARGRGDTAITAIKLELDGAALGVSLEQRSESTWRGASTAQVGAGHHAVRATVIDDQGRTGSFRWTFDAGP